MTEINYKCLDTVIELINDSQDKPHVIASNYVLAQKPESLDDVLTHLDVLQAHDAKFNFNLALAIIKRKF